MVPNFSKSSQAWKDRLKYFTHELLWLFSTSLQQARSQDFWRGVTWLSDVYVRMYKQASTQEKRLLLRTFWDRSRIVVPTWFAEYCIQFLAVHVCICEESWLRIPREKALEAAGGVTSLEEQLVNSWTPGIAIYLRTHLRTHSRTHLRISFRRSAYAHARR